MRVSNRLLTGAALSLLIASPTLAQGEEMSMFQMFFWSDDTIGLIIIWLLILMSIICIGYSIMLILRYRKTAIVPEDTQIQLEEMLSAKQYRDAIAFANEDPSYLGKVASAGLNEASNGYAAMERAIEETSDAEVSRMLRPIEYLSVLGNISPMMGLFGTVYGMIVAFKKLVEVGNANPQELAAGISTALVTTLWGLIVAIPALAAYAIIRNKIDAMTSEGTLVAEELIRPFKPGAKKSSSSSASSKSDAGRPRATPKPEEPQ